MSHNSNQDSVSRANDPYASARAKMTAGRTTNSIRSDRRESDRAALSRDRDDTAAPHKFNFDSIGRSLERGPEEHNSTIHYENNSTSTFIATVSMLTSIATIFSACQGFSATIQTPTATAQVDSTTNISQISTIPQLTPPKATDDSGALDLYTSSGRFAAHCPLKHTKVDATIFGSSARVTVKQVFRNNSREKLEAKYRFPLSENSAVDSMVMKVGDRVIKGDITRREVANSIYQTAKRQGYAAALLDQERTNVFTQSIANLEPGKEIEISINYTETLAFCNGNFQFVFPTVVGPRYQPFGDDSSDEFASNRDNNLLKFASLSPPPTVNVASQARRPGHDLEINVAVNSGLPIQNLTSRLHKINVQQENKQTALVSLQSLTTIPNRDFVLDISVAGDKLQTGYVTSKSGNDGFLSLMVIPPQKVVTADVAPRELIFVVDCSGSQAGRPIQKTRDTLNYVIDHVNDKDTFQIITFNDGIKNLFGRPENLTLSRRIQAKAFVNDLKALGGTIMEPAVEAACESPAEDNRLRIVSFMTDGYVSDDYRVIGLVKSLRGNSRWFPFGVGDSVNRTLIENIAREGGGESEFVLLDDSAETVGKKFYQRIAAPVLTDVHISCEGIELLDIYPREVSDVWSNKPLFFNARYTRPGHGKVNIDGFYQGKPYHRSIPVVLDSSTSTSGQLGQTWARARIDDLMAQDWEGVQSGVMVDSIKDQIVSTALQHHLVSQFTSFVAVDQSRRTSAATVATVDIPVATPEGLSIKPNANTSSPVSQGTSSNFGLSITSSDANQRVVNSAVNPIFSGITNQLNCLSCAASNASTPDHQGRVSRSPAPSEALNPIALLLLPWAFVAAPYRALLIVFITFLALAKARRLLIGVQMNQPLDFGTLVQTFALYSTAALLAFIHLSIVNFRG
ncbi:MAG: VIT and VWA domain-containing protein [Candidatus Obscuribacterales bacterium]|nr:VIT and VWA domain-containing protein [Candidatus Obscuribacterales bacterium]